MIKRLLLFPLLCMILVGCTEENKVVEEPIQNEFIIENLKKEPITKIGHFDSRTGDEIFLNEEEYDYFIDFLVSIDFERIEKSITNKTGYEHQIGIRTNSLYSFRFIVDIDNGVLLHNGHVYYLDSSDINEILDFFGL